MEQLQIVGEFLKTHRFWFALGVACLFAFFVSSGSANLATKISAEQKSLDGSFKSVSDYKSGAHPNQEWQRAVVDRQTTLKEKYSTSIEKLYREQAKLMTWPPEVQPFFGGRPFGAKLDDKQNEYLSEYRKAYETKRQVAAIFWDLNVLDKEDDGKIIGVVDAGRSPERLIHHAVFTREPNSIEAWLAQEQLWVQAALVRAIARANKYTQENYQGENAWLNAPIKRVVGLLIGAAAVGQTVRKELVEYQTADPNQPKGTFSGGTGDVVNLNPKRYVEKNDQYRLIPVGMVLEVDQEKITNVLGELANADFHFVIGEVRISHPQQKVEMPTILESAGVVPSGRSAANPLYNCVQMEVLGTMRFYEMPASLKEKEQAKSAETGSSGGEARPTEAKPAEAKSSAKAVVEEKPAAVVGSPALQPEPAAPKNGAGTKAPASAGGEKKPPEGVKTPPKADSEPKKKS